VTVELLEAAAAELGDLREQVVFLGGATVGLWFTDPAARGPRATYDVDVVADVTTLGAYAQFQEELRRHGFVEDVESGITVRYRHRESSLILDVVPLEARLAGLSGRWLKAAAQAAVLRTLPSGVEVRVVPPAWLAVTKFEAFADRGSDDCLSSRDFEDVVLLVDARAELAAELDALPDDARAYIRGEFGRVLVLPSFEYGVEGALAAADSRERARTVTIPRFERLAGS
jgi:nucleotidyltransferase AbiEii toxin of type IV toxin-antitoxin system